MGTNYYRIPTEQEMVVRKQLLQTRIRTMPLTPSSIEDGVHYLENPLDEWNKLSPWDEFVEGTSVHLGKRSGGWKFLWNFHDNKYYSNKKELIEFVLSGRVVDEYGTEMDTWEFLDMAFEWGQPDGWDADSYLKEHPEHRSSWYSEKHEEYIDGLRVSSSTEFS